MIPSEDILKALDRDLKQTKGKVAHLDDRVTLLEQRFDKPWAAIRFVDPRMVILGLWLTGGVYLIQRSKHRHEIP
jgi:hypothetical protein